MTIREKIIHKSIAVCERRLAQIKYILEATPLSDIIELRKEGQRMLDERKSWGTPEFSAKISQMAKQEKSLLALYEKQKDAIALIEEKVKVDREIYNLKSELFRITK